MPTNLEIETKAMIDEREYNYILSLYSNKSYIQTNYYIDDKEFSLSKQYGLRIRFKNNQYELTLKISAEEGKIEINQNITENDFLNYKNNHIFPIGEVENKLNELNIDINSLFIFGEMTTTRTDIKYNGSLISVDKSVYCNVVDYEVECESTSLIKANNDLKTFLKEKDVDFKINHLTKLARLINAIKS